MEAPQKIIRNSAWLYFSEFIVKILMFFFVIYLARTVGDEQFGVFNFALSFAFIFMGVVNLGMNDLLIRNCSLNKKLMSSYISNVLVFRLAVAAIVIVVTQVLASFLGYPVSTLKIILVFSIFLLTLTTAQLFISGLRVYEDMRYEALIKIIEKSIVAVVGVVVLFFGFRIFEVSLVYLLSGVVSIFFAFYFFLKKTDSFKFELDKTKLWEIIKLSIPFIFLAIFYDIYLKIDITFLSVLKGDAITGWYSASTKMIELLIVIPLIFNRALLPSLSSMYQNKSKNIPGLYNFASKYLFIIALPIFSFTLVMHRQIFDIVYGQEFINGSMSFLILTIALIFLYQSFLNNHFLVGIRREKVPVILMGSLIGLNVILNLLIIPILSLNGAAITTLICNFLFYLISYIIICRIYPEISIKDFMIKLIVANVVMVLFVYMLKDINLFVNLIIAGIVYVISLFGLKIIKKQELSFISEGVLGKNFFKKQ